MAVASVIQIVACFALSPLLLGVIRRTKAIVAGRSGEPLLQAYYDLLKLLKKGAVYSRTTTWIFRSGPIIGLAAVLTATPLVPLGGSPAAFAFPGDLILFVYLLGLLRFFTVIAALDTGSSFEGMGASREVTFSALAELALLIGLAALARQSGALSLSTMYGALDGATWARHAPTLALLTGAFLVVFLTENARLPIDDPTTHLELTMIHEAMVLDHGGPDLAFVLYTGALKLWLVGALVVGLVMPVRTGNEWMDAAATIAGLIALAVGTGILESSMARWRLVRVPQLLVGAGVLSALALVLLE